MRKDYPIIYKGNSTEVEDAKKSLHLLNGEKHRTFKAVWLLFPMMVLLFIFPYTNKTQSAVPPPPEGCGAHTSFLLAGDSLMIAYQLLTGATNYSLKLRKSPWGSWIQPTGDVASGCSRLGYFVLYLRDKANDCQTFVPQPGNYVFQITAYDEQIADSCVMEGDFNLTAEQVWKTIYSSWDVVNTNLIPIIKK